MSAQQAGRFPLEGIYASSSNEPGLSPRNLLCGMKISWKVLIHKRNDVGKGRLDSNTAMALR